jgi:hypothetical protein
MLGGNGVFAEDEQGRYGRTPLAAIPTSDAFNSGLNQALGDALAAVNDDGSFHRGVHVP